MRRKILFLILSIIAFGSMAQKFTISGYVADAESGEKLIGASIYDQSKKQGTTTNTYGFYSFTVNSDSVNLMFSYVGYKTIKKSFLLNKDMVLNIDLNPVIEIEEVTISGENVERIEEMTKMSTVTIPVEQIKKVPALLGEVDLLKTLQYLPGVQGGTEGTSGLIVRGGSQDQNLILLDGVPVYNVYHLFGFLSVFNADAINHVELIKGGFPARYGGRLSSILDIRMKEGNMKKIHGEGAMGIIASKLTIEGPIVKDKVSFLVSGRRTYFDLFMRPMYKAFAGDGSIVPGYFFDDVNGKINWKVSPKDKVYLSFYRGSDTFYNRMKPYTYLYDGVYYEESSEQTIGWGNITGSARWNHQVSSKLFANLTAAYTNYNFNISSYEEKIESGDSVFTKINSFSFKSGIEDYSATLDFDFLPNPDHYIKFGLNGIYHTFTPETTNYKIINTGVNNIDSTLGSSIIIAKEFAVYAEDDFKVSKRFKVNGGIRASGFYVNDELYYSLEPRVSMKYSLLYNLSVKASYARMKQYIHLLTNSTIGLPTDLWVPATDKIKPQMGDQVALGVASTLNDKYEFSIEGYYKWLNNVITYKNGANYLSSSSDWQEKIVSGIGKSYGMEMFLQKKTGDLTGWISYTLSWTTRQFPETDINFGEEFPFKYDSRHMLAAVLMYDINEKWEFSSTFIFRSGRALTLPTTRYAAFNETTGSSDYFYYEYMSELTYFEKRNDFRESPYHRLDVGLRRHNETSWGEISVSLGLYNAYSRRNPFYYYFGYDKRGNRALLRVSLFPMIPFINIGCKF